MRPEEQKRHRDTKHLKPSNQVNFARAELGEVAMWPGTNKK